MAQRALDPEKNASDIEAAYAAVPEGSLVRAEILDGVLYMMNRAKTRHQRVAWRLARALGRYEDGDDGIDDRWLFLHEPELHLGTRPDKLGPDLAGWRRKRLVGEPDAASIAIAPDWVCEVLSESTEDIDRHRKWRIYRRERVAHYWLVDPDERTLEVYELGEPDYRLVAQHRGDDVVRAAPFDKVELKLATLWAW